MEKDTQPVQKKKAITNNTAKPASTRTPAAAKNEHWKIASLVFICLVCGFFGGWLAVRSLGTDPDHLTNNRETLVIQEGELIADIADRVSPSVVSITVESLESDTFRILAVEGAGTGIILTSEGLIITNKHVVDDARNITVITNDGTEYKAVQLLDTDPFNDIAYLKIENARGLKPALLGDSTKMRIGQKVVAIGNALGQYSHTVTSGIVSGLGRPIVAGNQFGDEPESLQNLFQTDAAINPGNSGGPLVNMSGEIIGITTAVAGNAENVGFAIPINDVAPGIESVKTHNRLIKPYLGVRYVMITNDIAQQLNLARSKGALIMSSGASTAVVPESPAEQAGIREGDIITKINDTALDETHNLATVVSNLEVGEIATLTVVRGKTELVIKATLVEAPRQ